jgi:hypothetical protein
LAKARLESAKEWLQEKEALEAEKESGFRWSEFFQEEEGRVQAQLEKVFPEAELFQA